MNSVRSNNPSLKYKRYTVSGSKDIGIRKFELVAKTQFVLIKGGENMFDDLRDCVITCVSPSSMLRYQGHFYPFID